MRKPKNPSTEKPIEVTVATVVQSTRPKRATTTKTTTTTIETTETKVPTKKFNIEKRDNGTTTIVDETKDTYSFSTDLGSLSAIVSPTSTTTASSSLAATGIKKTKRGIMSSPSSAGTITFTSTVKQPSRTRDILDHDLFSNISAMNANTVVDSPIIINNKKVLKRTQTPIQATATAHKHIFTPNTENNFVKMVESHQKLIGEYQYKQLMNAQEVRNVHLESAVNGGEYKSDFDIIDEILSPKTRPLPSPAFKAPVAASTSKSATTTKTLLSKPYLESKQSDKENKENANDDDDDDDDDIPPPPSKKSKSSIKIKKLDQVEPTTTVTAATRASKRTLTTAKSIDYKEKSPEPLKPRQTRVKVVEKVETKKRKFSEEEVNDEQDGGGCSLKLYEDDEEEEEEEEKLIGGENKNVVEKKQSPMKKETIKRVTRQRNTGVKLGKLISKIFFLKYRSRNSKCQYLLGNELC